MTDESLEIRLARLRREQAEADARYNDALTALDRALSPLPGFPQPPPAYDPAKIAAANESWDILPGGPPPLDGSIKGRLRRFVWRLVGPAFDAQRRFNATIVEHLNRNIAAHEEAARAVTSAIACLSGEAEARAQFQSRLLQFLQTVTLYVDTKDRSVGGQVEVLNAGLSAIADDWLKRWESLTVREERFVRQVRAIERALDDVRQTSIIADQTALSLKRDVERLLETPPASTHASGGSGGDDGARGADAVRATPAPDLDAFKYLGFEDAFRGARDDIRRRLTEYVPLFAGAQDVLDVGCGRGEFLELLQAAGVRARGIDTNDAMVRASRERGLDVTRADALGYLVSLPDASLGGLFASQVVEHLDPSYLMKMLETAGHKIRPGGLIVLETINPACWLAFFESYLRDLTHVRALHPETLQYLLRVSGFHDVELQFKAPVDESARLARVGPAAADADAAWSDLVDAFNDNAIKLNARLFTYQDYAAIGRR